jgi:hypothetical protein
MARPTGAPESVTIDDPTPAVIRERPHEEVSPARFQKSGVFATGMGYSWSLNDCS